MYVHRFLRNGLNNRKDYFVSWVYFSAGLIKKMFTFSFIVNYSLPAYKYERREINFNVIFGIGIIPWKDNMRSFTLQQSVRVPAL